MLDNDNRSFCLSIAGFNIAVEAMHKPDQSIYREYFSDRHADMHVCVGQNEIDREMAEDGAVNVPRNQDLENTAIFRRVSDALLERDTFLMHGAVVAIGDCAYMFTASSGTGKTTHIKKWLKGAPNAYVVNGDKPYIRLIGGQALACGSPWCGKERMSSPVMVPLKAIVLMSRANENEIHEISFGQAFTFLLQQTYRPDNENGLRKTLSLLMRLKDMVRFYQFKFDNMREDAFDVAFRTLTGLPLKMEDQTQI